MARNPFPAENETMVQSLNPDEDIPRASRRLPDNADPAVDYATAAERPGLLRGEASLLIETRQAQRLVYGRRQSNEQPGIIGLVRYGLLTKRIWGAAMLDDPYADWFLLQMDEALATGRETVRTYQREMDALLTGVGGVNIQVAHSLKPVRVPLQFANPYGYMGAYLIAEFDALVRAVLTARHVGLIARDPAEHLLARGGRTVRRTFVIPMRWKDCAVCRDDLRLGSARGQAVRASLGELPQDVLEGTRRAAHAPAIQKAARAGVVTDNTSKAARAGVVTDNTPTESEAMLHPEDRDAPTDDDP